MVARAPMTSDDQLKHWREAFEAVGRLRDRLDELSTLIYHDQYGNTAKLLDIIRSVDTIDIARQVIPLHVAQARGDLSKSTASIQIARQVIE